MTDDICFQHYFFSVPSFSQSAHFKSFSLQRQSCHFCQPVNSSIVQPNSEWHTKMCDFQIAILFLQFRKPIHQFLFFHLQEFLCPLITEFDIIGCSFLCHSTPSSYDFSFSVLYLCQTFFRKKKDLLQKFIFHRKSFLCFMLYEDFTLFQRSPYTWSASVPRYWNVSRLSYLDRSGKAISLFRISSSSISSRAASFGVE